MKCEKCGKELDSDAKFCEYCGAQVFTRKDTMQRHKFYENYIDNDHAEKSRKYFFISFLLFDLALSTIVGVLGIPNIWVYAISAVLYGIAIVHAFKGLLFSIQLKKDGHKAYGLVTSILIGLSSIVIVGINAMSILSLF